MAAVRMLICSIMLICLCLSGSIPAQAADRPWISAEGYCVIDADTGELVVGGNELQCFAPASITKIMTALVAAESCPDLDEPVEVSEAAVNDIAILSSTMTPMPKPGECFTVRDVLYGLVMCSGNECANMLAEHAAQSTEAFVQRMNARAKEAGAVSTHFVNAHGLDDDEHLTTPYDMALIMKAALDNPVTAAFFSAGEYTIPATEYAGERVMISGHEMVNGSYPCDGVFAGKTGYTVRAGWTLVTAAERSGRRMIAVVMRCGEGCSYSDTEVLLNFAFQKAEGREPSGGGLVYDPRVSDYSGAGCTVTWQAGPDAVRAELLTWIEYDSTDRMIKEEMTVDGGTLACRLDLFAHGGKNGVYTVQAYVYDAVGNARISTIKVLMGPETPICGLQQWNGAWYYGKENGALALNWLETEEGCYYFDYMTAKMQTGWRRAQDTTFYLGTDGKAVSGWQTIEGRRYYFQVSGAMATGLMRISGFAYWFGSGGALQTFGIPIEIGHSILECS